MRPTSLGTLPRHLVRETVDATQVRLAYTPAAALVLDRAAGTLHVAPLAGFDHAAALAAEAAARFAQAASAYDGRALRALVHRALQGLDPVPIRPSGVYLVPDPGGPVLARLQAFVATLAPSQLWRVPVTDTPDTRTLVIQSTTDTVQQAAQRTVGQLAALLARGAAPTRSDLQAAADAFKRLHALVATYEAPVDDQLTAARDTLAVAAAQLRALLDRPEALAAPEAAGPRPTVPPSDPCTGARFRMPRLRAPRRVDGPQVERREH